MTAAMTMPAMAPEDRCEDDLEAWSLLDGLDSAKDDPEALGLVDGLDSAKDDPEVLGLLDRLDTCEDEDVVTSAPDQQMGLRLWGVGIPLEGVVDEVLEKLLRGVASRLLEDVDEDSTALASAFETFAFALAKLVIQMLT